jgi:hypothetical protein
LDKGFDYETETIIPSISQYFYRGPELEFMTYYEYTATVDFKNQPWTKPKVMVGNFDRKKQEHFLMATTFPGYNSAFHVLRSSQVTPLAIGEPAPKHPGPKPSASLRPTAAFRTWKRNADCYARYYLSYFRPDGYRHLTHSYTWEALEAWVEELAHNQGALSQWRLMIMLQHMKGIRSSSKYKAMASHYRRRRRDLWPATKKTDLQQRRALEGRLDRKLWNDGCEIMTHLEKLHLHAFPNPSKTTGLRPGNRRLL